MEYRAIHRYADMSARKIRPVAQLVRGRMADEALELLKFLPNRSARLVEQAGGSLLAERAASGSRFVVELPSAQPATAAVVSSDEAPRIA